MTDIVLDTAQITINVVTDADIEIIDIEIPAYVMQGESVVLEFDVKNHGNISTCFAAVRHGDTPVHRWDGTITTNGTHHVTCNVAATSADTIVLNISAGYTYA